MRDVLAMAAEGMVFGHVALADAVAEKVGESVELSEHFRKRSGRREGMISRAGWLFHAVIGTCDQMLGEPKQQRRHPTPAAEVAPREFFQRMGAEEWDRWRASADSSTDK